MKPVWLVLILNMLWKQWFGVGFLILNLKTFSDSEDFNHQDPYFIILLKGLLWIPNGRKSCVNFWLEDSQHFSFDKQNFQKIEKFHSYLMGRCLFNFENFSN